MQAGLLLRTVIAASAASAAVLLGTARPLSADPTVASLAVDVDGDGDSDFGDAYVLQWWLDETGIPLLSVLAEGTVGGPVIDLSAYFESQVTAAPSAALSPSGTGGGGAADPQGNCTRQVRRFPKTTDGNPPDGPSEHARITPDGKFFVFSSKASKVVSGVQLPQNKFQVYRVERMTDGTTVSVLVSRKSGAGGMPAQQDCLHPSISDDGQIVVFDTPDPLAGGADTNGKLDVYARDVASNSTVLVSRKLTSSTAANGASELPALSGDGAFVAFTSDATNITNDPVNGQFTHVFRVNRTVGGSGVLVSLNVFDEILDGSATADPALRAVGDFVDRPGDLVAFQAKRMPTGAQQVWARDLFSTPGFTYQLSLSPNELDGDDTSRNPSIASAAGFIVFSSMATNLIGSTSSIEDIYFVRDGSDTPPVRANLTAGGNGDSNRVMIASDGELMTFSTDATNLLTSGTDTNGKRDVILSDLDISDPSSPSVTSSTLVSVSTGGVQGNDTSETSDLSDSAAVVVFESDATNLVASDGNTFRDIFESSTDLPTFFLRADADNDGQVQNADASFILNYLFLAGPAPDCFDAADADDNGTVEMTDAIYLLNFRNLGGPAPPAPFPNCDVDETADTLSCLAPACP